MYCITNVLISPRWGCYVSYNTYNAYNHKIHAINIIHTNANHTTCCNRSPSLILTTYLSNMMKRSKELLSKKRSFRYTKLYNFTCATLISFISNANTKQRSRRNRNEQTHYRSKLRTFVLRTISSSLARQSLLKGPEYTRDTSWSKITL